MKRAIKAKNAVGYQYLQPHDGPVFKGLEAEETVYAKDQPEYNEINTDWVKVCLLDQPADTAKVQ